jgi:hypothetical protein
MSPTATTPVSTTRSRPVSNTGRSMFVGSSVSSFTRSAKPAAVETVAAAPELSSLNDAWAHIAERVTNRSAANSAANSAEGSSTIITVDLASGESAQEFSTRLRMLLLFMNREEGSVSATVSPSFKDDTYPAMLALVKGFQTSGASEDWRPDGPRSIRMGKAKHLFVSVDMPVADRSPSPDTLIEIVAAHRIDASWYDQRVAPRASAAGLTTVMFGVPSASDSVFKRERARNLAGRPGGVHFSRQSNWSATAAV